MYCTVKNVRDVSELLEDESIILDGVIAPQISKAQSRIDTVLKTRYVVPLLVPVPEIIKSISQDMAAGFVLTKVFSNQLSQEHLSLSNQLIKRADGDLALVIKHQQLDGLPGIKLATIPGNDSTPAISSTSKRPSPIEGIIKEW